MLSILPYYYTKQLLSAAQNLPFYLTTRLSSVPRLAVLSFVAAGRRSATLPFGQSGESCQVWAGSRQVGTAPLLLLLLLATAFGTETGNSVGSYQHPVTRVTVKVVFSAH